MDHSNNSTDTSSAIKDEVLQPTEQPFDSSHAAFVDHFGAFFTFLACTIAGYQIM